MDHIPKKMSAADLIEEAGVYATLGINRDECNMPLFTHDRGVTSGIIDPHSVGAMIHEKLQPALEKLATAVVLEQNASFFDSGLKATKEHVASQLLAVMLESKSSADAKGVAGLVEHIGPRTLIPDAHDAAMVLVNEISSRLADKVRVTVMAANMRGK